MWLRCATSCRWPGCPSLRCKLRRRIRLNRESMRKSFAGIAGKIQAAPTVTTTTLSGTGNLGSGTYSTTDRNDVTTLSPVTVIPPVTIVPPVLQPVFHPTTP